MGARGYILKQDCAGLASACRAVMRGQMVYGSKVVEKLPDIINRKAEFDYGAYGITAKGRPSLSGLWLTVCPTGRLPRECL